MVNNVNQYLGCAEPFVTVVKKKLGLQKWPYILLFTSAIILLGMSGNMLALFGYNYAGEGGSALEKIHPSTFVLIISLFAFLAHPNGEEKLGNVVLRQGIFPYILVCLLSIIYTQVVLGQPVSGLIVSWLTPGLLLALLLQVNKNQIKYLGYLLYGLLFINTLMAVIEYKAGVSIIPSVLIDYTGTGEILDMSEWGELRASGLFGHPLTSTLVCGLFIVANYALVCFKQASRLQYFTMLHCALALPLFGGRTSIAMTFLFVFLISLARLWMELTGRGSNYFNVIKIKFSVTIILIALIIAFQVGILDQLIDRVQYDNGSGYTRILAMEILADTSNLELILGDIYKTLGSRQVAYGTIYGIEIFWVGMILNYGVLVSLGLFYFTLKIITLIAKKCGAISYWSIAFFFVSISSGVGLVVKNTTFSLLILLMFCMYYADESDKLDHQI